MNLAEFKKFKQEFDSLTPSEQWQMIIDQDRNVRVIMLDNDNTQVVFDVDSDNEDENYYVSMKSYLGNSGGAFFLLEAIGIRCEGV